MSVTTNRISLKDFIKQVGDELRSAVNDKDPFFIMGDVELEVSFELEAQAGTKFNIYVLDINAGAKGKQVHTVKMKLTPFVRKKDPQPGPGGGGAPLAKLQNSVVVNGTPASTPLKSRSGIQRPTAKSKAPKVTLGKVIARDVNGRFISGKVKPSSRNKKDKA